MKPFLAILLFAGLVPLASQAQLTNGGLNAGFGIDADTRANWMKYGLVTGNVTSDDWFAPSGFGNNVIDTSNWATYLAQLQAGANLTFSKRMSQLLYAKVGGKLWLDAVYARDYGAAASMKDSTVFTMAAKNGDNPSIWTGGVSSVPNKNDLLDAYAHMRRDGVTAYDSLWFLTGVAAYGNAANSYYDIELYKYNLSYYPATGTFSSAGAAGGHSEWLFDVAGNVTQTGDLIIAVTFLPGSAPIVDVRIWVSQLTFNNFTAGTLFPKYFNFNGVFSINSGSGFGYASIVSKAGTTAFGSGIANYSGTPANDTTYATPWGTTNSTTGWAPGYQSTQFIEVGLNLTRMGVDPALYSTLDPCTSMFSDIFFASRSSASFTAALKDFIVPLTFLQFPYLDFSIKPDTLRCNRPTGTITLTDRSTAANYTWKAINGGNITGANGDSSQLNVSKPGSYVVSASPALGCPAKAVDTIAVPIDTFPPEATAFAGMINHQIDLYGGDPVASNYPTPFGGSKGLTWAWTGPNGFTSTVQNPVTDTVWGTYLLTVTEKRNGCTDTASVQVLSSMFTILLADSLRLEGVVRGQEIDLRWKDAGEQNDQSFVVERSDGVHGFVAIGTVYPTPDAEGWIPFTDKQPFAGVNLYRVKAVAANGAEYYSQVISLGVDLSSRLTVSVVSVDPSGVMLGIDAGSAGDAVLVEYNLAGQVLSKKNIVLAQGMNTVGMPAASRNPVAVLALFADGKVVWCRKVLF